MYIVFVDLVFRSCLILAVCSVYKLYYIFMFTLWLHNFMTDVCVLLFVPCPSPCVQVHVEVMMLKTLSLDGVVSVNICAERASKFLCRGLEKSVVSARN